MSEIIHKSILFTFILIWLCSCQAPNADECEENPGCAPPTSRVLEFNFDLISMDNQLIQLTNADLDSMKFETQGMEEPITLNQNNKLNTLLTGLNQGFEPETAIYVLSTQFGDPQFIEIVVSTDWADDCHWCKTYFVSEIIQNEQDTIFSGKLDDEVVTIKIK